MDTKNLYLEKLLGEIVEKYQKRYDNREEKIVKAEDKSVQRLNSLLKARLIGEERLITGEYRPENYYCMFLGSEPEAANNPNSKPILTASQAIQIINAYIQEEDKLVIREHPHMLNGSKNYTGQEKDSFDLKRGVILWEY